MYMCKVINIVSDRVPVSPHEGAALSPLFLSGISKETSVCEKKMGREREREREREQNSNETIKIVPPAPPTSPLSFSLSHSQNKDLQKFTDFHDVIYFQPNREHIKKLVLFLSSTHLPQTPLTKNRVVLGRFQVAGQTGYLGWSVNQWLIYTRERVCGSNNSIMNK